MREECCEEKGLFVVSDEAGVVERSVISNYSSAIWLCKKCGDCLHSDAGWKLCLVRGKQLF
ncbi:hypothetical protein [Bartonella tribocorum]|uniref:Uncharacterized protein n=1 Tax=Bartonella tribocorum TaxID=85701 RepID=A0A2M6USK2_9HYPH|nr:hypothetical protein [Bartonella tribocorum]PIT69143.1 hypothetical protein CEV08_06850 [Bartonella tribocorum]